jgi:hypothetical protein
MWRLAGWAERRAFLRFWLCRGAGPRREKAVAGDEGGFVFDGLGAGVGEAGGVLDALAHFDELDLGLEAGGEDDVRLVRSAVFLGKATTNGGAGGRIDEGAAEAVGIADEDADGAIEGAVGSYGGGWHKLGVFPNIRG